jgi:hypothetical protein
MSFCCVNRNCSWYTWQCNSSSWVFSRSEWYTDGKLGCKCKVVGSQESTVCWHIHTAWQGTGCMTCVTRFVLEILQKKEKGLMFMKTSALHMFVSVHSITKSCHFASRNHSVITSYCVVSDTLRFSWIKFKVGLESCVFCWVLSGDVKQYVWPWWGGDLFTLKESDTEMLMHHNHRHVYRVCRGCRGTP